MAIGTIVMMSLAASSAAQDAKPEGKGKPAKPKIVKTNTFSATIPKDWYADVQDHHAKVFVCNKPTDKCESKDSGFSKSGVATIVILPSDRPAGSGPVTLDQFMAEHRFRGSSAPQAVEIASGDGIGRKCMVSSRLIVTGIREQFYGCEIGGMIFQAAAEYEEASDKKSAYDAATRQLLGTVVPRSK